MATKRKKGLQHKNILFICILNHFKVALKSHGNLEKKGPTAYKTIYVFI